MSKQRVAKITSGTITRNAGSNGVEWAYRPRGVEEHYHAATPSKLRKYLSRKGIDSIELEAVAEACRRLVAEAAEAREQVAKQ